MTNDALADFFFYEAINKLPLLCIRGADRQRPLFLIVKFPSNRLLHIEFSWRREQKQLYIY